jgi:P27 family predicted phage terminase small subunit
MRGRKPKPTHLRLIQGNPGKRPLNRREPRPKGVLSDPPAWFNEEQRVEWAYVIGHAPFGLLTTLDRSVLELWVVHYLLWRRSTELCQQYGQVQRDPSHNTVRTAPWVKTAAQQAALLSKIAEQLGFTPSARPRLQLPADNSKPDDFDKLIGTFDVRPTGGSL